MRRRLVLVLALQVEIGCGGAFAIGCGLDPARSSTATAPAAAANAGAAARTVQVAANRGWQDSGVTVGADQKFQLVYRSGQITDKDFKIADAHGTDYVCGDPGCCEPLPDERRSALIARIGGNVFPVGNGGEYSSPAGGTIYLRVNDCDDGVHDNTGELRVEFIP